MLKSVNSTTAWTQEPKDARTQLWEKAAPLNRQRSARQLCHATLGMIQRDIKTHSTASLHIPPNPRRKPRLVLVGAPASGSHALLRLLLTLLLLLVNHLLGHSKRCCVLSVVVPACARREGGWAGRVGAHA